MLVTPSIDRPPGFLVKGRWCQGGHPVLGNTLPLSIPPQVINQGLYGVLSLQPVTLLRPCALQYPNLATQLTHIQVLIYSPSKVPVTGPSVFFQSLPSHLDYHELGLRGLHCSSFQELVHSDGTVYRVDQGNSEEPDEKSIVQPLHQSLLISLFLQHSDPFTTQLSDIVVTEMLIEHHLEDILNNNRQAVVSALQTELKKALKSQTRRNKVQEKMNSAAEVILSSSISIVSCSSNVGFRNACLNSMKVQSTHELSASLRESLRRVTSWKFIPKGTCYSAEIEEHPETMEPTRTEI
ncbi:type 2 DNA topoisomerase 6 subunit B-like [Sphaeramia orbicularis]|uniref:type 2 DNA topoisomerase 6 subunit B-like n=1 Tax=Sphaeramia orbicularis TaxID=375764 RepID=UPI00117C91F4|nr:uncharacterized protein LOC115426818 [Sphaeramia orbicularis]